MSGNGGSQLQIAAAGVDINASDQVTQLHFGSTATPLSPTPPSGTDSVLEWNGTQIVGNPVPNAPNGLTYNTSTHVFAALPAVPQILATTEVTSCQILLNGAISNGQWNCTGTFSWGSTLANNTYKIQCSLSEPQPPSSYRLGSGGGFQADIFWSNKTTTGFTYYINDDHSGSNGAIYFIDCTATN
jgi:hypothetical protein